MYLSDAEEGIPLYLVEIVGEDLRNWLCQAGIEVGVLVWKSQKADKKNIIWVADNGENYFFSPNFASGFLVKRPSGQIRSLDTLGNKKTFTAHYHLDLQTYNQIRKLKKLSRGSQLVVVKHIIDMDFLISTGKDNIWLNSDSVFNIWGDYSDQMVSLGSMMIGQKFVPRYSTGGDSVNRLFDMLSIGQNRAIEIIKIVQHQEDYTESVCILSNQAGNMVTLSRDAMENIIVRLCDICWACGLCR